MRRHRNGFSLMELMITVVVIGILATAAVPRYTRMVDRIREAEGIVNLSSLLTAQVIHFQEHGSFSPSGDVLLVVPPPLPLWTMPGGNANSTWTVTAAQAEIIFSSQGHGHADPGDHQLRGRANSDGTFSLEAKRPGQLDFGPL